MLSVWSELFVVIWVVDAREDRRVGKCWRTYSIDDHAVYFDRKARKVVHFMGETQRSDMDRCLFWWPKVGLGSVLTKGSRQNAGGDEVEGKQWKVGAPLWKGKNSPPSAFFLLGASIALKTN